jgi:hypothetical protein
MIFMKQQSPAHRLRRYTGGRRLFRQNPGIAPQPKPYQSRLTLANGHCRKPGNFAWLPAQEAGKSKMTQTITHMVIMARIKKMIRMIMYGMSRTTKFRR